MVHQRNWIILSKSEFMGWAEISTFTFHPFTLYPLPFTLYPWKRSADFAAGYRFFLNHINYKIGFSQVFCVAILVFHPPLPHTAFTLKVTLHTRSRKILNRHNAASGRSTLFPIQQLIRQQTTPTATGSPSSIYEQLFIWWPLQRFAYL